jgi:uncharacterized phage protein (TIGR01671 family)
MREILFRGKSNKKWCEGSLLYDEENDKAFIAERFEDGAAYLNEVFPKTVGQYTGLTDKNETKIFEGDIVTSAYYLKKDKTKNSIIEYGEWNCSCCNGVFGWVSNGFVDFRDEDVIVIGNIHDNPELLKGE